MVKIYLAITSELLATCSCRHGSKTTITQGRMAQHPGSSNVHTPASVSQQKIQSSHLSNVAISFLTPNKKKGQTLVMDSRQESTSLSVLIHNWNWAYWLSLYCKNQLNTKKKPKRKSPPVCPWPCCSWSRSSWLGANNPAHLMSRLGKARWLVDLIICSYYVICVV